MRAAYIASCKDAGYRVRGYYFSSQLEPAMTRNATREGKSRVADAGVRATYAKLELPELNEGFDELFYVKLSDSGFAVEEWNDEV